MKDDSPAPDRNGHAPMERPPLVYVVTGASAGVSKFAIRGFTDSLRTELMHTQPRARDHGAAPCAQHTPIRLVSDAARSSSTTRPADFPTRSCSACNRERRPPTPSGAQGRMARRESDRRQPSGTLARRPGAREPRIRFPAKRSTTRSEQARQPVRTDRRGSWSSRHFR